MGAAALAPLCVDCALAAAAGVAGAYFRRVTFYAQASQTVQIITETDVYFAKSSRTPIGLTGIPREPKGAQSDAKESPWEPKEPKRKPKVAPRRAK